MPHATPARQPPFSGTPPIAHSDLDRWQNTGMLNWLRVIFARVWRIWAVGVAIGLLSGLVSGWVRRDAVAGLNVALFWVMIALSATALVSLVYIDLQGRARRLYRDRNEAYALTLIVGLLGGAGSIALFEVLNIQVSALLFGGDAALISAALSEQIGPPGVIVALALLAATAIGAARWARQTAWPR